MMLSPRSYAALATLVPLPLLAALLSGNAVILAIFGSNVLLIIATVACSCFIVAATLRIAVLQYLLAKGSTLLLLPALLGILVCLEGSYLGHPWIGLGSFLLAYLGVVAYLGGVRFALYLAPGLAVLASLPILASLGPWAGYTVVLSLLGAAGVLTLVRRRSRPVHQEACEYCAAYGERGARFCDYCGRRLPGSSAVRAPGRRLVGLLVAGLVIMALALGLSVGTPSLLGSGLNLLSAQLFPAGAQGASPAVGGLGNYASEMQYEVFISAILVAGAVAAIAKRTDMTSARRFDNSLGLDEHEFATFASLAHERRGTGAELLDSTKLPGGWTALNPLLEKLVKLRLMEREIVTIKGAPKMLWGSDVHY